MVSSGVCVITIWPFVWPWTVRRAFASRYPVFPQGMYELMQGPFRSYASSSLHRPRRAPPTNGCRGHRAHACSDDLTTPFRVRQQREPRPCASRRGRGNPTRRTTCSSSSTATNTTPARPVEWWTAAGEEGKDILGGRDELGGGTWLGCTKGGKLAFLTNVREPNPRVGAKSRGELPVRFLQGRLGPLEYATEIAKVADQYNGFNLILVDVQSGAMVYISNKPSGAPVVQTVPPGFHVLSNAAIDSPWPKALRLGQSFSRFLSTHDDAEVSLKQMVEELMTDTVKADRCMVPDTGVEPDWEHQLSSIFIDTERGQARYGTRSMAAVAVKLDGEVSFYERSLNSCSWKENLVQFDMEVPR